MFELMEYHESWDDRDRRYTLVLKPLEDGSGVQLRSVVNQIVHFPVTDLGDALRCTLQGPRCQVRNTGVVAGAETDLKRSVVGYVAGDDMDVLEARDGCLQVGRSCWIPDDCEHNGVGSDGLENQELGPKSKTITAIRSRLTNWRMYSRPMPREAPTTTYEGIANSRTGERGRQRPMILNKCPESCSCARASTHGELQRTRMALV